MIKGFRRVFQILFAIPWLVFGLQHFMYAEFVAGLVPAYFPLRIFWAYFTGAAMLAAGLSLIVNRKSTLAAILLGAMLVVFILLIHVPKLAGEPSAMNWTRALQDVAIAATALMFAGTLPKPEFENGFLRNIAGACRFIFAALLIIFGIQQFLDMDFLTAKVPSFLPLRNFWVYLTGIAMIAAGVSVFINQKTRLTVMLAGAFLLLINLLNYGYLLANDLHNPLHWTASMLNLAINCGVFILAEMSPRNDRDSFEIPE